MKTNNLRKKRLAVAVCVILLCTVCFGQADDQSGDIASDFEQAVGKVLKNREYREKIEYSDVTETANSFVAKYSDVSAVEFLRSRIAGKPAERKLALLSLAKLATANQPAREALQKAVSERNIIRHDAFTAILFLEPSETRGLLEALVTQPGPPNVRRRAAALLAELGDENTLVKLDNLEPAEQNKAVKKGLKSAVAQLRQKLLSGGPDKQLSWGQLDMLALRKLYETPLPRKVGGQNTIAAEKLYKQGHRFSRDYLEYKLGTGDMLAIAIIGNQKETWAIEGLQKYASQREAIGDLARDSLVGIGTSEALRALEQSLVPGGHSSANKHIAILLELHGDEVSAELMKILALDARFTDRERAYFKAAYTNIGKRLAKAAK